MKKKLQLGTLCECVMAETIAKMYNLDCFADVFHTYVRDLPANILYRLRDDNNKILCRYIYYNEDDLNTFLIQYGNPIKYDADLYLDNNLVKIEFKDQVARAGEKEFFYDEEGKLTYTLEFAQENPDYIPLVEVFNKNNNIIDLSGNYKIEDDKDRKAVLKAYFESLGFDVLVSLDDNSRFLAITKDCIDVKNCLSLDGSEIRRSGKNSHKIFTPNLMIKSILKIDGNISGDTVKIQKEKMIDRINNKKITGKKINHLFFVKLENIKEENGYYVFLLKNIKQLKPTLCVHMKIIFSRDELVKFYENIFIKEKLV